MHALFTQRLESVLTMSSCCLQSTDQVRGDQASARAGALFLWKKVCTHHEARGIAQRHQRLTNLRVSIHRQGAACRMQSAGLLGLP